jgi:hypothetical protein
MIPIEFNKPLIPTETALSLVFMGYDPTQATRRGTASLAETVKENFSKSDGSVILFNNGAISGLSQYEPDSVDNDGKRVRSHRHSSSLGVFPTSILGRPIDTPEYFGLFSVGSLTQHWPLRQVVNLTSDSSIRARDTTGIHGLDIYIDGSTYQHFDISPFGSPARFPEVGYHTVIVPSLVGEKRDDLFWNLLADVYDLALDEPTSEHGRVSYNVLTENPNVTSLRVTSSPEFYGGDIEIDVGFERPVAVDSFSDLINYMRFRSSCTFDDNSKDCRTQSGPVESVGMNYKVCKGHGYAAAEFVRRVAQPTLETELVTQ